jgi:hypothetical protein
MGSEMGSIFPRVGIIGGDMAGQRVPSGKRREILGRLRDYVRQQQWKTTGDFAKAAGLSSSTAARYVPTREAPGNQEEPGLSTLLAFARAGINPTWLLLGPPHPPTLGSTAPLPADLARHLRDHLVDALVRHGYPREEAAAVYPIDEAGELLERVVDTGADTLELYRRARKLADQAIGELDRATFQQASTAVSAPLSMGLTPPPRRKPKRGQ